MGDLVDTYKAAVVCMRAYKRAAQIRRSLEEDTEEAEVTPSVLEDAVEDAFLRWKACQTKIADTEKQLGPFAPLKIQYYLWCAHRAESNKKAKGAIE